ncbi:MAG: cadherin repeat domain-containing protein, partial [Tannerellaceae bacterium]|nr:cadherin repeat domain-containing protein [Tannerellaceae bacterium]
PGERLKIKATVTDPDKDSLLIRWWQFKVGSYDGNVSIDNAESASISVDVPSDAKPGDTIHLILEAEDNGTPALTRYHRLIIRLIGKVPMPAGCLHDYELG